jgi:TetR/AcrR family transcriptional repressor of nem operon
VDEIAARLALDDPRSARGQSLAPFRMMVGTIQLTRALADRRFADEVLEQGLANALEQDA